MLHSFHSSHSFLVLLPLSTALFSLVFPSSFNASDTHFIATRQNNDIYCLHLVWQVNLTNKRHFKLDCFACVRVCIFVVFSHQRQSERHCLFDCFDFFAGSGNGN